LAAQAAHEEALAQPCPSSVGTHEPPQFLVSAPHAPSWQLPPLHRTVPASGTTQAGLHADCVQPNPGSFTATHAPPQSLYDASHVSAQAPPASQLAVLFVSGHLVQAAAPQPCAASFGMHRPSHSL
jgi:hypothetical protein